MENNILTQSHVLGQYSMPTVCEGYRDDDTFDDEFEAEEATESFMQASGCAFDPA